TARAAGELAVAVRVAELVADRERRPDPVRRTGRELDEPGREALGLHDRNAASSRASVHAEERQDARRSSAQVKAAAKHALANVARPRVPPHHPSKTTFDGRPGNAKRTRVPFFPSATVVLPACPPPRATVAVRPL